MFNRYWGNDRRKFQRLKVNLTVWYRVDSPLYIRNLVGEREIEATTIDLGAGGMAISTKYNIPAWTTLIMKFILFKTDKMGLVSFSDAVEVIGEVRSSILLENHEYRLGIRFAEIKQQDKSEIGSFVESTLRP